MPYFDKTMADKLVINLMNLLGEFSPEGITIRATDDYVESLKQSDSPFSGFVISSIVDPSVSKQHYDDWVKKTLERTMK